MSGVRENLERILTLVPMAAANPGITLGELARRLGCGEADVHADLARILLCGVPPYLPNDYILVDLEGDRVYLGFAERFARPVSLLVEEAIALKLALDGVRPLAAGAGGAAAVIDGLRRKVERVLGERDVEAQEAASRVDASSGRPEQEVLRGLAGAISTRASVEISYYTAARDAMTRRVIRPQRFEERDGVLYVEAYCSLRRDVRSFRVDRIRELGEVADRAAADPARLLDPEPFAVVIRFAPEVARFVVERYGGVTRDPESGHATLTIETKYPEWLFSWLLAFGGQAEILSPPQVRAAYAARLDRILALHAC